MAFARAKRFNYKNPDLKVSPADFYISSSLHKSCTISRSARFPSKKDEASSSICSRKNCRCNNFKESTDDFSRNSRSSYRSGPSQCSTPYKRFRNSNSTDLDKIKDKITNLNKEDIRRFTNQDKSKNSVESQLRVRELVHKFETVPNGLHFWTSEEFIDDDYHSYTSSDDLDYLNKVDNVKVKETNRYSQDRRLFEDIVIEKIDKIGKIIEKLQDNLLELQEGANICCKRGTLQKYNTTSNSELGLHQDNPDEIKYIIVNAIEKLREEFESKHHAVLSQTIEKLRNLAKEVYAAKENSRKQIKKECDNTASNLYEEIMDYLERNDTLEFENSQNYEVVMPDDEKLEVSMNHECFNYENICQILSDQLQVSQRQLEDLKKDKRDITIKCGNTRETLMAQSSVIDMLHEEIEDLKKTC